MKRKFEFLIILSISILISPVVALAISSPPGIPLLVYGEVTIDGQVAPIGTEISAEIDSIKVATINITNAGRYFIEVPDGKVNEGKMITFKVNGIANNSQLQCVNIDTTPSINFNLAIATVSPPPPAGGGGGGGGGGAYVPASTSTNIKGDVNKDNKVDKYDFALMMVNWGKTGSIDSDLNGDNKVDKYDFALLMANWGVK